MMDRSPDYVPIAIGTSAGRQESRLCQGYGGQAGVPPTPMLRRAGRSKESGLHFSLLTFRSSLFFILALFTFSSCTAQRGGGKSYYHEDLYPLRPKFTEPVDTFKVNQPRNKGELIASRTVNAKVDGVLDSINTFTMARRFIDGYTIQIYSGQNREEAMGAKRKMSSDLTDLNSSTVLEYVQPKFRVRVGSYYSRLEAQKDLVRLKRWFPNAILVPEKIPVR